MRKSATKLPRWKLTLFVAAYNFVGVALLPRWYRLFYPPLFRTPAGLALHLAWRMTYMYVNVRWILPRVRAVAELREVQREELRARLGREPTEEELVDDYVRRGRK